MKIGKIKIINSFKYAIQGIITSLKTEKNMKIHILVMAIVILFGIILKISKIEWMLCIILFAIVIAGELFNTAIETVVNMITTEKNELAKITKDVSAGAVFVLAIGSAIVGLMIFVPKLI